MQGINFPSEARLTPFPIKRTRPEILFNGAVFATASTYVEKTEDQFQDFARKKCIKQGYNEGAKERSRIAEVTPKASERTKKPITITTNQSNASCLEKQERKRNKILLINSNI